MAGKTFDELEIGMTFRHDLGRTISEADNMLFCAITLNTQPLHINEDFARKSEFGGRIVNGLLTLALAIGITVPDLTQGTIVANLGYETVKHPHPMFHGDTLYVETTVTDKRESQSRPECGIITLHHIGMNQTGVIVLEVTRSALFLKRVPS